MLALYNLTRVWEIVERLIDDKVLVCHTAISLNSIFYLKFSAKVIILHSSQLKVQKIDSDKDNDDRLP